MVKSRDERVKEAELFLSELGRGLPESERVMAGYAEEATVQTDAKGKKMNAGWWPKPWKEGAYINGNQNCYACISSSRKTPNPKTGELRYWRGEASFGHGLALMVDDIGSGRGSKGGLTVQHFLDILPPTVIVETSPDNFQLWYFLAKPEANMLKFKSFLVTFVSRVLDKGGDNTIKDVSRYGRMPCGVNNKRHGDKQLKYADKDGQPFAVEVAGADYGIRYDIDALAEAFGFSIVVPEPRQVAEVNEDEFRMDMIWLVIAQKLMAGKGEGTGGAITENMSGKFRIACPWGDEHTNGDPYGAYFRGPIPGGDVDFVFGCGHDTCRKFRVRKWDQFVDAVVMPMIEVRCEEANETDYYWPKCKGKARFIYGMKDTDYYKGAL